MTDQPAPNEPDALDRGFQWIGTTIVGLVLIGVGLFMQLQGRSRKMAIAGLAVIALGVCFIGYSLTMKQWCVPQAKTSFSASFHPNFSCVRKGWLSF